MEPLGELHRRIVVMEQRHADLTQHVGDVSLGDAGLTPHFLDEARKFVGEGGCHAGLPLNGTNVDRHMRMAGDKTLNCGDDFSQCITDKPDIGT